MDEDINILLDLSDEVLEIIEQQRIDIFQEIQEELPSIRLKAMSDPSAPLGSKDIATFIVATATLVGALTPLVIRLLNQYKPDTTEIIHEETETRYPDGRVTIRRIRFYTKREYNKQAQLPQQIQQPEPPQIESGDHTK
jgi:hypothetical protein